MKKEKKMLLSILLLAILVRLAVLAVLFPWSENIQDTRSFEILGSAVLGGKNPYLVLASTQPNLSFAYGPSWMWASALLEWFSRLSSISFQLLTRLVTLTADALIALLLMLLVHHRAKNIRHMRSTGLWYALNPLTPVFAAFHGQVDAVMMLGVIAALAVFSFSRGKRWVLSSILLGGAIAVKHFAVILIPILMLSLPSWRKRLWAGALSSAPFVLTLLPYVLVSRESFNAVRENVFAYAGAPGHWGYTFFLRLLNWNIPAAGMQAILALGLLLAFCWYVRQKKKDMAAGMSMTTLSLFVVTPGFAIQYLAWLLPFLLLFFRRERILFLLPATGAMLATYGWQGVRAGILPALLSPALLHNAMYLFLIVTWGVVGWLFMRRLHGLKKNEL